jgi:1,4-alpha-glucan branching enzyme
VTGPVAEGGLGFDLQMEHGLDARHPVVLRVSSPIHRRWHHNQTDVCDDVRATPSDYVLPLSHDEVVHGKGSLLNKMAGDRWQQLANLRALYAWMYAHPGKKLLFMGAELAPATEWAPRRSSCPWQLLEDPAHAGACSSLVRDLNHGYTQRATAACFARDSRPLQLPVAGGGRRPTIRYWPSPATATHSKTRWW